jgi:hypothetical protein
MTLCYQSHGASEIHVTNTHREVWPWAFIFYHSIPGPRKQTSASSDSGSNDRRAHSLCDLVKHDEVTGAKLRVVESDRNYDQGKGSLKPATAVTGNVRHILCEQHSRALGAIQV